MIVRIAHVPPKSACVDLSASWMQVPVIPGAEPNNVVNVQPRNDSFLLLERVCTDEKGNKCQDAKQYKQVRTILLQSER